MSETLRLYTSAERHFSISSHQIFSIVIFVKLLSLALFLLAQLQSVFLQMAGNVLTSQPIHIHELHVANSWCQIGSMLQLDDLVMCRSRSATCMIVFGTAFFSPSCLTASTNRWCSWLVHTSLGLLSARA